MGLQGGPDWAALRRLQPQPGISQMVWKQIRVYLPSGWHEVPGETPRLFRSGAGENSGRLYLSTYPAPDELHGSEEDVTKRLLESIVRVAQDMGLGAPADTAWGPCEYGLAVGAVFESERCGIAQSWLLYRAGEPVISAFYTMGHVETVQAETEDLEGIIASLDLLEVDPPSWAQ